MRARFKNAICNYSLEKRLHVARVSGYCNHRARAMRNHQLLQRRWELNDNFGQQRPGR